MFFFLVEILTPAVIEVCTKYWRHMELDKYSFGDEGLMRTDSTFTDKSQKQLSR